MVHLRVNFIHLFFLFFGSTSPLVYSPFDSLTFIIYKRIYLRLNRILLLLHILLTWLNSLLGFRFGLLWFSLNLVSLFFWLYTSSFLLFWFFLWLNRIDRNRLLLFGKLILQLLNFFCMRLHDVREYIELKI